MASSRTEKMMFALIDAQSLYSKIVESFDKFSNNVLYISQGDSFLEGLQCDMAAYRPLDLDLDDNWLVTAFRVTFLGRAYKFELSTKPTSSTSDSLLGVLSVIGLIGPGRGRPELLVQVEFDQNGSVASGPDFPEVVSKTIVRTPYCRDLLLHIFYNDLLFVEPKP